MSTTEPPASPSLTGQGDTHPTLPNEGTKGSQQVTEPTGQEPVTETTAAEKENTLKAEMKPETPHEPEAAATPIMKAPPATPSRNELLPEKMKGLSVSTDIPEGRPSSSNDAPPPPPAKDEVYLNPTSSSRSTHPPQSPIDPSSEWNEKELPDVPGGQEIGDNKGTPGAEDGREHDSSQPEIQSIMGQFQGGQEQLMSPRLELAEQFFGTYPPRQSSLDHKKKVEVAATPGPAGTASSSSEKQPARSSSNSYIHDEDMLSRRSSSSTAPPPPEPEKRFDFHRFLEQLRHRTADPVAKFLRSFLHEFGKRQWMVHEQVKIISDFLAFITNKMAMCEVWRDVSDNEFDNAKEGMEKLVMNRLYSQTFSPAIPQPPSIPRSASRSKRRELERLHGPWRRGQHQEDIERDDVLAQKMKIYSWVREEHLDIAPVNNHGRRFLNLAQQGEYSYCRLWYVYLT